MKTTSTILVATWSDGVFAYVGETYMHELAGHSINALARDGDGRAIAVVDGHALRRRTHEGAWHTIATTEYPLACALAVGDHLYVGTDDARVLRVNAAGDVMPLGTFDNVRGRDTWFAGGIIVDGTLVGPPLGVRSITATADGAVLLANVHVGGIPRSTDGGITWQPTIAVDHDVHEIRAHPTDPRVVIAAAATGLCVSRDAGATWTIETDGLHATHCTAVAFSGNDIFVSAATQHFATEGTVYRRALDGNESLAPVDGGLPRWLDGIVDTRCIDARDATIAIVDRGGSFYMSLNAGGSWTCRATGIAAPSCVLVCDGLA